MDLQKLLDESSLFGDLPQEFKTKIVREGILRKVRKGATLFSEGADGVYFYMLIEGIIKIYKSTADGKEITVKLAHDGEIFAETILFESERYPVSATALTETLVLGVRRDFFLSLLREHRFTIEFLTALMKKLRYLADRLVYLSAYDIEERFFMFLESRYGKNATYEVDISKKEIASAIGTVPETFSRLVLRLKERDVIEWEGKTITIKNR